MQHLITLFKAYIYQNRYNLPLFLLLLGVWFLSLKGYFSPLLHWLETDQLHSANQAYLSSLQEMARNDLILFAELSALLEMIQSINVGISFFADFNVDVGNLLSAFTHQISHGELIMVASNTAILLLMMIDTLAQSSAPWFFHLSYATALLFYLTNLLEISNRITRLIRHLFTLFLTLFILMHLLIPYSLHLASIISAEMSGTYRSNASKSLQHLHHDVLGEQRHQSLKDNAQSSLSILEKLSSSSIHHKTEHLATYTTTHLALMLFDLILVPLFILMGLYRGINQLIRKLFMPA